MNYERLKSIPFQQLLSICRNIGLSEYSLCGSGWEIIMKIRATARPEDVVSVEWYDDWYNKHSSPPDIWKESTCADCVHWSLNPESGILSVVMFDGDFLDGQRIKKRATWSIALSDALAEYLRGDICYEIAAKARRQREEELEEAENRAVDAIVGRYLSESETSQWLAPQNLSSIEAAQSAPKP